MAIQNINHYSFTNPSSVYDEEAMTALELCGRLGAKIQEVVEEYNKTYGAIVDNSEQAITLLVNQMIKDGKITVATIYDEENEAISMIAKVVE